MTEESAAAGRTMPDDLRIGSVIADSLRVFAGNLVPFLAISALLVAPVYLFLSLPAWIPEIFQQIPDAAFEYGIMFGEGLLGFVAHAAIVYGSFRYLQGRRLGSLENIGGGLVKAVPALLVAIAVGVISLLGFLVFVIPGFIVLTVYWVAVPVAVIERKPVGQSLARSAELTRGLRWKVFGLVFLLTIIQVAGEMLIERALDFENFYLLSVGISWAISSLLIAIEAVVCAVSYRELRRIKEGSDVAEIAAVFD